MTTAQLHAAHAQGMTEREIDDQEAEDEAFGRIAQQQTGVVPMASGWRCPGHVGGGVLLHICMHCQRSRSGDAAMAARAPDLFSGRCAARVQL